MNFSIEKMMANGEVEIISTDTCSIEITTKPTIEQMSMLCKMVSTNGLGLWHTVDFKQEGSVTGMGYEKEIINSIYPNISKCLSSGSLYMVDSSKDILNGAIYPCNPANKNQGVVGYVGLDWLGHVSNSEIYGSMNLSESNYSILGKKTIYKLVIDFPTHACNGNIDTIYFTPNTFKRNVGNAEVSTPNFKLDRYSPQVVDVCCTFPNTTSINLPYSIGSTTGRYNDQFITEDGCLIMTKATTDSLDKINVYKNGKIGMVTTGITLDGCFGFDKNGKKYLFGMPSNSSLVLANAIGYEIVVEELVDSIEITRVGTQVTFPQIVDMGLFITSSVKTIYWGHFEGIHYCLYKTSGQASLYYISFWDAEYNVIKHEAVELIDYVVSTFNDGINKYISIYGNVFNKMLDKLGPITLGIIGADSNRYLSDGNNNFLVCCDKRFIGITSSITLYNSYLCKISDNQVAPIKIKLTEPLVKNNAETLKLIFDIELDFI